MMVRNKIRRFKAAFVSAAMVATTLAAPVMTSFTNVTAATKEVTKLPYTFTADGVKDGLRQANVALPKGTKAGSTVTLNFTTASKVDASIGVYGFGTDSADDGANGYWYTIPEADQPNFSSGGKSEFSCQVVIPSAMAGNPTKIGLGIWYPEDNSKWTLESIDAGATGTDPTDPGEPSIPVSKNAKSGTCDLVDNGDGTATITATLAAQYAEIDADGNKVTEFNIPLTQGTDEEDYAPYLDENGDPLPKWEEGDPINAKKFKFTDFGIDELTNLTFQSFEYVIETTDYDMSEIQYGGGINVAVGSDADTEKVKGKNGYWYNDQGEEDMEKYGSEFKIDDVHGAYKAENCGKYAKLVWDVPAGVQPHIDFADSSSAVGFQYWWGKDDNQTGVDPATGEESNYAVIPEITLKSATAIYTRTVTVPYTESVKGPTNVKLTSGSDTTNQQKFSLAELELEERDMLSAVEFTFKSEEALQKFVGACGISVDPAKNEYIKEGWYQSSDIAVINCENNTFKVMWVLPETIRKSVYAGTAENPGEILIGYWYGDVEGGTAVEDITVSDITYHVFRSQEEDVELKGEDGLVIPEKIELEVGETYDIKVNVENSTFTSERPNVVSVDENGKLTALEEGLSKITVTTPEGQTAEITVVVNAAAVTTVTTTAPAVTTTKPTTTTVAVTTQDPDEIIDWTRVLYGDVNLDGKVTVADLTALAKFNVSQSLFPLANATARENADCEYDKKINSTDSMMLTEYNLNSIGLLDLGPADKSSCPMYKNLDAE